ncbi:MAG: DUF2397 family protein, partial [Limisphaerales bacterium]
RLRQTGRHLVRGLAPATIDRSGERARLEALAEAEARELVRVREQLLAKGPRRLAELGPLSRGEFRLFLELIGRTLAKAGSGNGLIEGVSSDGSMRLRLEPAGSGGVAVLETEDGDFAGRDYWVRIEPAAAQWEPS